MRKTKKPPLPVGTPVEIDIAQGMSAAQGVVTAAEYDDGWMYQIDLKGGDDCRMHRNEAGELWVCDFEAKPISDPPDSETSVPVPHTVEVMGDLLVVLDEDGNGCDAHKLRGLRAAKRQLRRWQDKYTFDYAEVLRKVSEFFANL